MSVDRYLRSRRADVIDGTALKVLGYLLSGGPRTRRGMAKAAGVSPNAVQLKARRLERLGLARSEFNRTAAVAATCRFIPAGDLEAQRHDPR